MSTQESNDDLKSIVEKLQSIEQIVIADKAQPATTGEITAESKVKFNLTQLWGFVVLLFAIGGSYALTVNSVSTLKDDVKELKTEIMQLDNSIKDQNEIFEYLIIQDTALIKKLPPRLRKRFE